MDMMQHLKTSMSFNILEHELNIFDWTYMMSDDHSVWQSGTRKEKELQTMINECSKIDKEKTISLIKKYTHEYGARFNVNGKVINYEQKETSTSKN